MFINLNAEMARYDITQEDICKCISKCRSNVSEKMNGRREFSLKEIKLIRTNLFPDCSLDYLFQVKEKGE